MAANTSAQGVLDAQRTYYFANFTSEVLRAITEDNVFVEGYLAWSLMDNFEWERGYTERFGVVFNDFKFGDDPDSPKGWAGQPTAKGQVRTRKNSSFWLQQVWERNALVDPTEWLNGERGGDK